MKNFLMAVGLMFVLALGVFAQVGKTNYYSYIETVNASTGARRKDTFNGSSVRLFYITFTNNSCYYSDEKGNKIDTDFSYVGEQNNMYVYSYSQLINEPLGGYTGLTREEILVFSKDYKRLDMVLSLNIPNLAKIILLHAQVDPATFSYLIPTANLTPLHPSAASKNKPPAPVLSKPSTPPPVNPSSPMPVSPASPGGGTVGNRVQCPNCYGSGLCNICKGNYKQTCTYCNGTGKKVYGYGTNATYENCAVCRGMGYTLCAAFGSTCLSGKCSSCRGTGYLNM